MRNTAKQIRLAGAFLLALLLVASAAATRAADGDPGLVAAARGQDRQQVRTLLGQRADVNVRDDDGATALLWAAHWNDVETADLLIRAGADANAANIFKVTPLSLACTNGSAPLVDLLLKAGANPNTPIGTGETPLMTCAATGNADAVKMLFTRGANLNATEPSQGQTALMWAASERHPNVVSTLVELGADTGARSKRGFSAIHFAAREGDLESVKRLIAAGVDMNLRVRLESEVKPVADTGYQGGGGQGGRVNESTMSIGATPLLVATVRGHVPLALYLLEQGADPNVGDAGFTPLHWASGTWEGAFSNAVFGFADSMSGIQDRPAKLQLVKALLARGANPDARMTRRPPGFANGYEDAVGATPFVLASSIADLEMMRLLAEGGADPKQVTGTNTNALVAATGLGHGTDYHPVTEEQALAAVNYLLELGVDPKGFTTFNENALFGPSYRGWNTLLKLLVEKGADVNIVSKAGVTPWLAASGFGDRLGGVLYNKAGADLLAAHGADPKLGKPCQAQTKCRAE
jgi:ankyrin repeat protein